MLSEAVTSSRTDANKESKMAPFSRADILKCACVSA